MATQSPYSGDRRARVLATRHSPAEVTAKSRVIYDAVLAESKAIVAGNFTVIGVAELRLLFQLYDRHFFDGLLDRSIREDVASLAFRLSNRMTSSGGTTERLRPRSGRSPRDSYTITVSTFLLFQSFSIDGRKVYVGGLECKDRLEALQRIFEHELLHLTEFLAWGESSCARDNFQNLSRHIFAHAGVKHELITPREVAASAFDIRVGDRVAFEFEGVPKAGIVNRITKRATILVKDPKGRLFSDGVTYSTFYVPISLLRKERAGS